MPTAIAPGMQQLIAQAHTKVVGCREAKCEWFLFGKEGMDQGAPFRHPAGAECGNHDQCLDPNCPCPQRLTWDLKAGRRGHKVVDADRPPRYGMATSEGRRLIESGEFNERLHEGVASLDFIRTRGL